MNRQVGPSIVLSVLIVCFFAVALFRHDPRHLTADETRKQAFRADSSPKQSSGTPQKTSPAGLAASSNGRATKPGYNGDPESKRRGGDSALADSGAIPPVIRRASARVQRASQEPALAKVDLDKNLPQNRMVHQPRSAFTIVEPDESLGDVAVRIYGSIDAVDALWRANCDFLPNKDSAPSPGSFLRTPIVR